MSTDIERESREAFEQFAIKELGITARGESPGWRIWQAALEWQASRAQTEQPSAAVVPEGWLNMVDRIVPDLSLEPDQEQYPAEWALWADRQRIRRELLSAAPTAPSVQGGGVPLRVSVNGLIESARCLGSAQCQNPWAIGYWEDQVEHYKAMIYTHPRNGEQGGEWVRCDERLPTEADGNLIWSHDQKRGSVELCSWAWSHSLFKHGYITHWQPTGLTRPQPPKSKDGE